MLSCIGGRQCDPRALKFENGVVIEDKSCGSNLAYAYFVSFIFLCSFLVCLIGIWCVGSQVSQLELVARDATDAESFRGRHHGQLWLPHSRFFYFGSSSLGWIYPDMGRIRSQRNVSHTLLHLPLKKMEWHHIFANRGKILYTEMFDMLKNMDPPLGFGNKCPYRLAYKKLIRMNMPVDQDGKVHFTTTLFALIRENLSIKMRPGIKFMYFLSRSRAHFHNRITEADEMDEANQELRVTIKKIWPLQAKKVLDLIIPLDSGMWWVFEQLWLWVCALTEFHSFPDRSYKKNWIRANWPWVRFTVVCLSWKTGKRHDLARLNRRPPWYVWAAFYLTSFRISSSYLYLTTKIEVIPVV